MKQVCSSVYTRQKAFLVYRNSHYSSPPCSVGVPWAKASCAFRRSGPLQWAHRVWFPMSKVSSLNSKEVLRNTVPKWWQKVQKIPIRRKDSVFPSMQTIPFLKILQPLNFTIFTPPCPLWAYSCPTSWHPCHPQCHSLWSPCPQSSSDAMVKGITVS